MSGSGVCRRWGADAEGIRPNAWTAPMMVVPGDIWASRKRTLETLPVSAGTPWNWAFFYDVRSVRNAEIGPGCRGRGERRVIAYVSFKC